MSLKVESNRKKDIHQILPSENENYNELLQENRRLKAQIETMRIERERVDKEARNDTAKNLEILKMGHQIKVLEMTNKIQGLTFQMDKMKLTMEMKIKADEAANKNNNNNKVDTICKQTTFLTKSEQLKWGVITFFEGCNAQERPIFVSYKEWYQFVAKTLKGNYTRAFAGKYLIDIEIYSK